jgi:potassium efflux system protein
LLAAGGLLVVLLTAECNAAAQRSNLAEPFLKSPSSPSTNQPTTATTSAPAAAKPSSAIPLPDVATRAEELTRKLRALTDKLPSQQQVENLKSTLEERDKQLQDKSKEVDALLASTPSSLELREQETDWRAIEKACADSRKQITDWALAAQATIQQLDAQEPHWTETLKENEHSSDLGPVLDLIRESVRNIEELRTQTQSLLRTLVNLQVRSATQDQMALDVLDRLSSAQDRSKRSVFERDSLPLWQVATRREAGEPPDFFVMAKNRLQSIQTFAWENIGALIGLVLLSLVCLAAANRLYKATRTLETTEADLARVQAIACHWIALGLLPPILVSYALASSAPVPLIGLTILFSFVPLLILLPYLLESRLVILLRWLAAIYAVNVVLTWWAVSPAHKREILFLSELLVLVAFAFLVRPSQISSQQENPRRLYKFLVFLARVVVVLLGIAVTANLLGYLKLAQTLSLVMVYSTFIAISLYTGVCIFALLLLVGINTPAAERLAAVRQHRDGIARWTPKILQWIAVLIWIGATLELLGIRDWVNQRIAAIFNFHIAGGGAGVTLGGVLGFFFILLLGYGISSSVRFVLREELLKRFHLSRGLPELIASTLHYLLLLLVFLYAVNAGGIELNKFTVLTGALGVGVGFGLQNVVNNFISGLILQFERPIHIGDVVELEGGSTGRVTRIGIRSSTILTPQGAEIIIPNSNFISNRVTNWTLTEAKRRIELPVGVAYGSDLKLVMELLNKAATIHESSLTSPAPIVYFKQFGDSSLDFELHFWVMMESDWVRVKSEVSLSVVRLLTEAGIEIPFPQRDLRLRSVDPSAAGLLLGATAENGDVIVPSRKELEAEPDPR